MKMPRFSQLRSNVEGLQAHELAFLMLILVALVAMLVKIREGFEEPKKMIKKKL